MSRISAICLGLAEISTLQYVFMDGGEAARSAADLAGQRAMELAPGEGASFMAYAFGQSLGLEHLQMGRQRGPGQAGLWVKERKIASIGIHLHRGVSIHGLCFNMTGDLRGFEFVKYEINLRIILGFENRLQIHS